MTFINHETTAKTPFLTESKKELKEVYSPAVSQIEFIKIDIDQEFRPGSLCEGIWEPEYRLKP